MKFHDIQTFQNVHVLVVGDIMLDRYWFGDVKRISPEAPVPVVLVNNQEERLGGAANVARNVASLGAKVSILGTVGDDESGNCIAKLLKMNGIKSYLYKDRHLSTTVKLRVIGRQQQLIRIDFEKFPAQKILLNKLKKFKEIVPHIDIVIFSDYDKGSLIHIKEMLSITKEHKKFTLIDPKGIDYSKYYGAFMITPNCSELRRVIGHWKNEIDLKDRVKKLREQLNLESILLTRSEEGMSLFTKKNAMHIAAQTREVYDVSGAGDTVIATLAVALAAHWSLEEAIKLANKAGGIVVGKLGTATVSLEELK